MRRDLSFAIAGFCAVLTVASAHGQTASSPTDPAAKLSLFGAAFAGNDAPPSSERTTAMAFLPGRGVVTWDVTGKTSEEAREAEVEAMGAADARAVQREIEAEEQQQAQLDSETAERRAFAAEAGAQRMALDVPAITGSAREADSILPLNQAARSGDWLGVKGAETLRERARMYAFAAVSGRSVGVNVLHDDTGWKNAGLTTDKDGFTGQRQAGLAWRKGGVQTSLSYAQQKDHTQILGMQSNKDHRVMLTMNLKTAAIGGLFGKEP